MKHAPQRVRRKIFAETLNSLKSFSAEGEGKADTSAGEELYALLRSGKFEVVGIAPSVMYAKIDGREKDLNALWVHPFGSPTLLLKHKRLPVLLMTNPGLRYNESMLSEMKFNEGHLEWLDEIAGISG